MVNKKARARPGVFHMLNDMGQNGEIEAVIFIRNGVAIEDLHFLDALDTPTANNTNSGF